MALLFMDGFDHYNDVTELGRKWDESSFGASLPAGRFGGQALYYVNQDSCSKSINDKTTIIVGFALKASRASNVLTAWLRFFVDGGQMISLYETTTGSVVVYRATGSGLIAESSQGVFAVNSVWQFIEFKFTIDNTVGSYQVKINGTSILSGSGVDTQNGSVSYVDTIQLGPTTNGGQLQYDDFYLMDNSGSYNNDFIGDCKIETLWPSGVGNYSQWTPSAGNNYENVDDTAPDDDSTYNDGDTNSDKDSYAMGNLTTTSGTIFAVQSNIYAKKTDAGTVKYKPLLYINSSDYVGDEISPGDTYNYSTYIDEVNPDDSLAWEVADINALEGGIQRTA